MKTASSVITTGYTPRPLQLELHRKVRRFNVIVTHRRAGKSYFGANHLINRALKCPYKNPQVAYVGPNYSSAKRVIWPYLKEFTKDLPGLEVNEAELRITFSRGAPHFDQCRVFVLGAESPDSLRGMYLDEVVLDEYQEWHPDVWPKVLRPTLSDRRGGAVFMGTPRGQNHFYDLYEHARTAGGEWFAALYRASETGIIPADELASARASMDESQYLQEYEVSWSSGISGAFYAKQFEALEANKQITDVPYQKGLPVITAWDLGYGDSTVVWFLQRAGRELHIIDYIESDGQPLSWYLAEARKKDYEYEEHILPHDAEAHELQTGKSRVKVFRESRLGRVRVLPKHAPKDGIDEVRRLLPRCWFDQKKCASGIKALQNYSRRWDDKEKVWKDAAKHDRHSHAADAFRYLAMGLRRDDSPPQDRFIRNPTVTTYDRFRHASRGRS